MGGLAERIRVPNRAQALSFPLANVALIRSAAQIATGVAGRVSQAIGFDEILQGATADATDDVSANDSVGAADLKRHLTDAIRQELAKHSIDLNHPLELRVHHDGSLRMDGNHPQGAEVEALLNSDPASVRLAGELAKATGTPTISLDLTSSGALGNMVGPGGYPNW